MARPRTRTAKLAPERLSLLHEVFGSSLHAFRTLTAPDFDNHPPTGMSYAVFRRVWDGREEQPAVVSGVKWAFEAWTQGLIERVKSAA